jgi:hypothetical protein
VIESLFRRTLSSHARSLLSLEAAEIAERKLTEKRIRVLSRTAEPFRPTCDAFGVAEL